MIIYNVTIKVEPHIADKWLHWLLEEHIPEIMGTGCFTDFKVVRLLDIDDSDGPTYAVQYLANAREDYDRYMEKYAPEYIRKTFDKWGDQSYSFRSVMKVVK
jgi:uncharacterized protein DUF4286